jgi:signal transduction histidine kinase
VKHFHVSLFIDAEDMEELERLSKDEEIELPAVVQELLDNILMWKEDM